MSISPSYFVKQFKERHPDLARQYGNNEKMLYDIGLEMYPDAPVLDWHDNTKLASDIKKQEDKYAVKEEVDTSPGFFESLLDYGVDEDSPYWMRHGYANSLTGLAEQLATGKARYQLEEYDMNIGEEVGSMLMSMIFPADAAAFFVGGGIGKAAAIGSTGFKRQTVKAAAEKIGGEKGLSNAIAKWGVNAGMKENTAKAISTHFLTSSGQLSTYEGLKGGVNAALQGENVALGIGHGVVHGGLMAASLAIPGGYLSSKNMALIKKATTKADVARGKGKQIAKNITDESKLLSKPEQRALQYTGFGGQYAAEVGTFTLTTQAQRAFNGEDITFNSVMRDLLVNAGFVGGMKGFQKSFSLAAQELTDLTGKGGKEYYEDLRTLSEKNKLTDETIKGLEDDLYTGDNLSADQIKTNESINQTINGLKDIKNVHNIKKTKDRKAIQDIQNKVEKINEQFNEKSDVTGETIFESLDRQNLIKHRDAVVDIIKTLRELQSVPGISKGLLKQLEADSNLINKRFEKLIKQKTETSGQTKMRLQGEWTNIVSGLQNAPGIKLQANKIPIPGSKKTKDIDKASVNELQQAVDAYGNKAVNKANPQLKNVANHLEELHSMDDIQRKELFDGQKKEGDVQNSKGVWNFIKNSVNKKFETFFADKDTAVAPGEKRDIYQLLSNEILDGVIKPTEANQFITFMEYIGKDNIKNINLIDTKRFLNKMMNEGKSISGHASSITKIIDSAVAKGILPRKTWTTAGYRKAWTAANLQIEVKADRRSTAFEAFKFKVAKKTMDYIGLVENWTKSVFGKHKTAKDVVMKEGRESAEQYIATKLHGPEGLGQRIAEVSGTERGAIKGETLKTSTINGTKVYYLDLKSAKGTNARKIAINKELGQAIEAFIKKHKIKKKDNLLITNPSKEASKKILESSGQKWGKSKFLEEIRAKGGKSEINLGDLRRVVQRLQMEGMPEQLINFLLGHGERISKIYGGQNPGLKAELLISLEGQRMLGVDTGYKNVFAPKKNKFQLLGIKDKHVSQKREAIKGEEMISPDSRTYSAQVNWIKEVYPEWYKKFKTVSKDILSEGRQDIVWGDIINGAIRVASGKIPKDVMPHEIHHDVVNILKASGDKRSKMLIKEGIEMFGSEEKLVQALGEYAAKRINERAFGATKMGALKSWVSRFWSHMKTKFFGKQFLTEKDITNVLGEMGVLRKGAALQQAKPGMYTVEAMRQLRVSIAGRTDLKGNIHQREREYKEDYKAQVKKLGIDEKGLERVDKSLDEFKSELREEHLHTQSLKDATTEDLRIYVNELNKLAKEKIESRFPKEELMLKKITNNHGLTSVDLKQILRDGFGVKDGNMLKVLTPEVFKDAASFIKTNLSEVSKNRVKRPSDDIRMFAELKDLPKLPNALQRGFMPVYYILKHYGGEPGKRISQAMLKFDMTEANLKGYGDVQISKVKGILKNKSGIGYDEARFNALKFIDPEFRKRASKKEEKYLKELDDAGDVFIDGNKVEWDPTKRVPYNAEFAGGSKLWRASMETRKFFDFFWNNLTSSVKQTQSPAEFEKYLNTYGKRYIHEYFTRQVNPKVLKAWHNEGDIPSFAEKVIKESIKSYAEKEAFRKGYKKGSNKYNEFVEKRITDESLHAKVNKELFVRLANPGLKRKPKYLKERTVFIGDKNREVVITGRNGKKRKVKAYIENSSDVLGMYAQGMSKAIALQKYFPDFSGLSQTGRKASIKSISPADVVQLSKEGNIGGYAALALKRQLGLEIIEGKGLNQWAYSLGGSLATTTAAMGLSSPTSGVKNYLIAVPRSLGTYGLFNTVQGVKASFSEAHWLDAKREGYLQMGSKNLGLSSKRISAEIPILRKFSMENLFKWNLMETTEGMARITSSVAGKLYFQQLLRAYKGQPALLHSMKNKKKIKKSMDEIWELGDEVLRFIDSKTLEQLTSPKYEKEMAYIMQKVAHMSHASSQGATSTAMLPLWMSKEILKPLTLFMRMAQSTTFDSYKNYIKPLVRDGNAMPMIRFAAGSALSGAALWNVYDWAFGQQNPEEFDDSLFSKILSNLWRAEFLGTLGEAINPYTSPFYGRGFKDIYQGDLSEIMPISEPIIARNSILMLQNLVTWMAGKQPLDQAAKEVLTKTIVLFGQAEKVSKKWDVPLFAKGEKKTRAYYQTHSRLKTLANKFKADTGIPIGIGAGKLEGYQPYYKELRDMFFFGSEEQQAKAYWKAYAYLCTSYEQDGFTNIYYRDKQAKQRLKSVIRNLNPIPFSKNEKGRMDSRYNEFLASLPKDLSEKAKLMEKEYWFKQRTFLDNVLKEDYYKKYSIYSNTLFGAIKRIFTVK